MKTFLHCTVTQKNGGTFLNPLMTTETHLITKLAKDHKKVVVEARQVGKKEFALLFGEHNL